MSIDSLPILSVQIAFNPTNIQGLPSTQTWTDVTSYVRSFETRQGRQHYLDRVEASSLSLVVNNRTGFFLNGGATSAGGNGTGYVVQPRTPIKVTASWAQSSSTSLTIGVGSQTFTTTNGMGTSTGLSVTLSNGANTMTGTCTAYSSTTGLMTVNVTSVTGTGTLSSWSVLITYPTFYGLIDDVSENITDEINSDMTIKATDLTKFLSLQYMSSNNFWNTYAKSTSATNWFRCDLTKQATVRSAVTPSASYGPGYTDYIGVNNFAVGESVYVNGLTTYSGSTQNSYSNSPVQFSDGSMFTLSTGNSAGTAGGQATATQTNTSDQLTSGGQAYYVNDIGFNPNGAMVYSANGSISLSNGSNAPTGYMQIADVPTGFGVYNGALDFWILGQGIAGQLITNVLGHGSSDSDVELWVSPNGYLEAVLVGDSTGTISRASASGTQFTFTGSFTPSQYNTTNGYVRISGLTAAYNGEWKIVSVNSTTMVVESNTTSATITGRTGVSHGIVRSNIAVNDGYWHHIGLCNNSSGVLCIYVDGTFTPITTSTISYSGWTTTFSGTNYALYIGAYNGFYLGGGGTPTLAALVDEVIISSTTNNSTLYNEVLNRYGAGTLLSLGFPVTPGVYYSSGTRIAQILCIAGFGTIVNGNVVLNSNTFFINDSSTPWALYSPNNYYTFVEPYYWDSPVTGSTALDLILQICDTDIGSFFQKPDGTFAFHNQKYYGYWSWTTSTTSLTVGTGTQTLIIPSGVSFTPGMSVTLSNASSTMTGTVITYASGPGSNYTLIVNITSFTGSGTQSTWNVSSWNPNNIYVPAPIGDHIWTDDTSSTYHYYGPTFQVLRDDVDTWTTVKVSPQSGTSQVYENFVNEPRWGYTTLTKSATLHTTLSLALSTATFLGNLFKTPLPRISNVELRSETSNGANMTALLNTDFGDIVTIKRTSPNASTSGTYPSQMGQISTNMVVESIGHNFQAEPGFWHTSFTLDPYPIRS